MLDVWQYIINLGAFSLTEMSLLIYPEWVDENRKTIECTNWIHEFSPPPNGIFHLEQENLKKARI